MPFYYSAIPVALQPFRETASILARMSFLKQITNAFFSGTNENNLQLASLKVDFSVVKVEAPAEFAALGSALTKKRRNEAEEGPQHRTARRLAALFEELVPSTPKLVTAYGLRVSEIIQKPSINPRGSDFHGPFKDYIGADATAMWAAATSGIPALGVYLLACLLARAWDATKAVSIWVEVVSERCKDIENAFRNNAIVSQTSLTGSHQTISRDDLALLDASARSWLRSADRAKEWEQDQLRLILENVKVPFPGGSSTYEKVISSWRQAMIGMEELLAGRPQSISSGSVLLALVSWHLFPDLIVLNKRTVKISFKDAHFPSTGVCTIGLTSADDCLDRGVRWSLMLSHLRYYGDPVPVASTDDFSRVSIEQLCLLAFGSILSSWRVNIKHTEAVARWFRDIWAVLEQDKSEVQREALCRQFGWLHVLVGAAESLLLSDVESRRAILNLIRYGYRRGKHFLGAENQTLVPYFGLCNPHILAGLSEKSDVECGIRYLRGIAKSIGLGSGQAVIICCHSVNGDKNGDETDTFYEYATAVSHSRSAMGAGPGVSTAAEESHARWLHLGSRHKQRRRGPGLHSERQLLEIVEARRAEILALSEECYVVVEGPDWLPQVQSLEDQGSLSSLCWRKPPLIYGGQLPGAPFKRNISQNEISQATCPSLLDLDCGCQCFTPQEHKLTDVTDTIEACHYGPIIGDWHFGLFARHPADDNSYVSRHRINVAKTVSQALDPAASIFQQTKLSISAAKLWDYLCNVISDAWTSGDGQSYRMGLASSGICLMASRYKLPDTCGLSLYGLCAATETYRNLNGAQISVKLISTSLDKALWLPDVRHSERRTTELSVSQNPTNKNHDSANSTSTTWQPPTLEAQSRSQAFACITHLASGTLNVDPAELALTLAMCCEDSIYVSGVILSDPIEAVAANDVRRLVGNIGHRGICMLVAPEDARVRPLNDNYNVVTHAAYDLKREDHFDGTTLHLSFTDWFVPLDTGGMRTIDQEVYLVESVISVLDRGKWVADLDVLAVDFDSLVRLGTDIECSEDHEEDLVCDYTSLDSWEEVLDYPDTVGVIRACGNWVARLAAVSILTQKGQGHCIGVFDKRSFCLKCLEARYKELGDDHLEPFQSRLPSFCID